VSYSIGKFRLDNESGDGAGCYEIKIEADVAKFTNVRIIRFDSADII